MLVMRPDPSLTSDPQLLHQKYDVMEDEYSLDTYPTYCGGPCTLLSGSTMEKSFQGNGCIATVATIVARIEGLDWSTNQILKPF